jgi:drug/metabolite transporter (DMT)-like permease
VPWIVPALLAPLLWGASNVVDEHLVNKATQNPVALLLNAGIFASLPAIFVFTTGRWVSCDWPTISLSLTGGMLGVLVYYPYFKALTLAPASAVILMWNLSPVLIAGIAHVAVHERLSIVEYVSLVLLVASSAMATVGAPGGRSARGALPWMLIASVILAVSSVLEKATYDRLSFWPGFGWLSLGAGLATTVVAILSPQARSHLHTTYRSKLAVLLIGNEVLDLGAVGALNLATSLAPVSLVHAVGGMQPVFILLVEWFLPRRRGAGRAEWVRTVVATALAIIGLGLLRSA